MAGPQTNTVPGVLRAGRAALAEGLRWSLDVFEPAYRDLEAAGMVIADWNTPLVWLPGEINSFNRPKNEKHAKGIINAFRLLPDCELKERALAAWLAFLVTYGYRLDTLSKPSMHTAVDTTATAAGDAGDRPSLRVIRKKHGPSSQEPCDYIIDARGTECGSPNHWRDQCPKNPKSDAYKEALRQKPPFVGI
jgi:hypothetical protein